MTRAWSLWKKGFDAWEDATAKLMEQMLKSPLVLGPAGSALTGVMTAKAASDKALNEMWARMGIPTRRDQERTLHALNQLSSRLLDIEEALDEARDAKRERR